MRIEGSREVPARRREVWEAFLDPRVLAKAMPGCEGLEAIGEGQYRAVMRVGIGGVKGAFEGTVRLADLDPPTTYRMMIEGRGLPGFVRGEARITLSDVGEGTGVGYVADIQVGGLVAGVGQRMLGGIARMMLDDFFTRMSRLLATSASSAGQKA